MGILYIFEIYFWRGRRGLMHWFATGCNRRRGGEMKDKSICVGAGVELGWETNKTMKCSLRPGALIHGPITEKANQDPFLDILPDLVVSFTPFTFPHSTLESGRKISDAKQPRAWYIISAK